MTSRLTTSTINDPSTSQTSATDRGDRLLHCAACHHPNHTDRRFCSACGESLWKKCLQCASECFAVDAFCGECGANQEQLLADRLQRIDAALRKAKELQSAGEFRQAISSLRSLPQADHPLVKTQLAAARQFAEQLTAEQAQAEQNLQQAAVECEAWLADRKYKEVVQRLQAIDPTRRTESLQRMLRTAEGAYREIKELKTKIAEGVQARRLSQLAPLLDRYLNLQPEDQKMRVVAERVREHLCEKARAAVEALEFEQAQSLLDALPLASVDDSTQQLRAKVREVLRLQNELRRSPHADEGLLAIAQRLCQLAPRNEKWQAILTKLKARLSQPPPSSDSPLVPWAVSKQPDFLGMPVEWLAGTRTLKAASPEMEVLLRRRANEFYLAAGLALQGLGKASIALNLNQKADQGGLLGKLHRLRKAPTHKYAWGLDIGRSRIKAIKLALGTTPQDPVTIVACEDFPYEVNLALPDADRQRPETIRAALQRWVEKYQPNDAEALCINCPATKTLGRFFQIPQVSPQKLPDLVTYETSQQIPFPLAELAWGYHVLEGGESQRVVAVALRTSDVKDQLQPFEQLGLPVHTMQAEALALHNFFCFDGLPSIGQTAAAADAVRQETAILEIGAETSNFLVMSPGSIWFRALRFGGNDLSLAVARQFRLTFDQAEQTKRRLDRADELGELLILLDQTCGKLVSEIQRSLDAFRKEQPDLNIGRLLLCGGAARQFGLLRHLRTGPVRE